jgi:hypothetical protein
VAPGGSSCRCVGSAGCLAVLGQEFVEQWERRVRVDGGACTEGFGPAGLERLLEVVAHALGGVGIEATHAGYLVAETLLGEDLRDAILGHPGLVAVPEPVRGEAGPDREPAGDRGVFRDGLDASSSWWNDGLGAGWASGHMATGIPGQTVVSAMTSRAGRVGAGSNRPSQEGGTHAGHSCCAGSDRRPGRGIHNGRSRRAEWRRRTGSVAGLGLGG